MGTRHRYFTGFDGPAFQNIFEGFDLIARKGVSIFTHERLPVLM
jgi:hypothetical protein